MRARRHALTIADDELAEGLTAFYADLDAHGAADNVVVMTWSEFGRRVEENASQGTDHGTAAPLFVLGNSVQGGVYGEPPDLSRASTPTATWSTPRTSARSTRRCSTAGSARRRPRC